ncbi:MAG TPA: hypothetical protein VJ820_19270 [Propionibacteriaceae bacterium]|nr:hypothetical protein [Propionibacteriaceae bacterium]
MSTAMNVRRARSALTLQGPTPAVSHWKEEINMTIKIDTDLTIERQR